MRFDGKIGLAGVGKVGRDAGVTGVVEGRGEGGGKRTEEEEDSDKAEA